MQKLRPDMCIGDNLRRLRRRKGYKQSEVVRDMQLMGCNISLMTYSKMERNNYNIKISELVALKLIFELNSFDEFFVGLTPNSK